MRFKSYIIYCVLLYGSIFCALAQEEEMNLEELLVEQLTEEMEEAVDISEIMERLNYYLKHPLNLNTVTASDLTNLVFLTSQQIENLLYHRQISGEFISILELQGITGFTAQMIYFLQNFITVGPESSLRGLKLKDVLANDEHMLMIRYGRNLERQAGYRIRDETKSRYMGDPNRYAIRYRWNYEGKIRVAFNMEKDAGEPFFRDRQRYGFDYYAGYLELNGLSKRIKKVILGDYALQFGQGLVLWNGLSFGKGAWIGSVARQASGLRGYSSLNENNFQRGIATKVEFGNWEWIPFVAYNSLSGKMVKTDSSDNIITTISMSGLHRTPTELSYRNEVKQLAYGSNVSYRYRRLKVGITYLGLRFNGQIAKGDAIRNVFDFEGKSLQQVGLSYQNTYRNYYVFGETAYSINGGWATINGLIASLHPKLSLFTTYRNYGKDYYSFYAQSLGDGSNVSNESGVYAGLVFHPSRKIEWVNYVDIFKHPWFKFRIDAPSQGTDFLSQGTYNWHKKGKLLLRYRHRLKQENLTLSTNNTNMLTNVIKNQVRLDYHYKLNDLWSIRSRGEVSLFEKDQSSRSSGFLIYQDVFWKGLSKWQFNMRVAYFATDDYDSRIYAYENDVLYASSFPVYYDKGWRSYLNTRWRLHKNWDIWARYALTYYPNRESIGSGLEAIEGKVRSDIKLQIRWEW